MGFLASMMAVGAVAAVAVAYYAGFNAGAAEHEAAANRAAIALREQTIEQQRQDIQHSETLRHEGNERPRQSELDSEARIAAIERARAEAVARHESERGALIARAEVAEADAASSASPEGEQQCAWHCTLPPLPDS